MSGEAKQSSTGGGYLPFLDGVRAIAVILVLIEHFPTRKYIRGGAAGVDIFFVLSGFLITGILLSEVERSGTISLRRFYVRRSLRLAPALLALVAIVTVVAKIANYPFALNESEVELGAQAALFYAASWLEAFRVDLVPFGHTWSLSVEEHFYLLWPAMVLMGGHFVAGARRPFIVIAFLIAAAWNIYLTAWQLPNWIYYAPDARACQLLAGALVAAAPRGMLRWIGAPPVAFACLACLVAIIVRPYPVGTGFPGFEVVVALAAAGIIAFLVSAESRARKLLESPPLLWIGRRSYGIYLWHIPVLFLTDAPVDGKMAVAVKLTLQVTLAILCAALSFKWIESPFLRWKVRFA
jgi:peptidoglycan/LPS O-acetylase OafA/YrhL